MCGVRECGFDAHPVPFALEPLQVHVRHDAARAFETRPGGQVLAQDPAVVDQLETQLGMRERGGQADIRDAQGLGLPRAQEFPSCGDVVEQLLDIEGRAARAARVLDARLAATVDSDLGPLDRVARTGEHAELRHRSDRRERFPSEAHGLHTHEILERADLARRVPAHGEDGVVAVHADAVVLDQDPFLAAFADLDADGGGLRVDGVLEQLLDHAGGSFDHFSRGDLVHERVVEESDPAHGLHRYQTVGPQAMRWRLQTPGSTRVLPDGSR